MENKVSVFEQKLKNNIRNYRLGYLLPGKLIRCFMKDAAEVSGMDVLLADRDGVVLYATGRFQYVNTVADVTENPGEVIKVQGRRMGHLYMLKSEESASQQGTIKATDIPDSVTAMKDLTLEQNRLVSDIACMLEELVLRTYLQQEAMLYIEQMENTGMHMYQLEKEDGLTGVFNKNYFESRMKIIERAQVVPVAALVVNINDWKFANDNFGDDESDRLIQIVGSILKSEAKEEYVIGRVDGDVFHVLIPLTEDNEAENYAKTIQKKCQEYEDVRLAPSVAVGIQYKTNIEEKIEDKLSDAEYDMFENKFELKNAPGYAERLKHGL